MSQQCLILPVLKQLPAHLQTPFLMQSESDMMIDIYSKYQDRGTQDRPRTDTYCISDRHSWFQFPGG